MPTANYRVLLGDDDPAMLRLLSRWLENAGYPTRTAVDGHQALEVIRHECPDFIITDWEMPRVNGLELCRQVRGMALPHYVYILLLTVKAAPDEIIAGLEHGADDFITKPVSEGELLARMRAGSRVIELERRLNLMANTDSLTGLMTQRSFYQALAKEWHRAGRCRLPLSCVMMDLDFFKQINDACGHPTGDYVLKQVAELLIDNCRASDSVCRYGGEEFCIMLPETDETEAVQWAERVRNRLASLRHLVELKGLRTTGSFGVAECRGETRNSEELVDLADQALLCAKRMGRDRVVRYASLVDAAESPLHCSLQQDGVFQGVRAGDVMSPLAVCLNEDETIDEAAQFLLQSNIPSTPVLDADGTLVGFLSEKDLMAAMASPDCWQRSVRTVMHMDVISYDEETPIRTVYEFFCRVSIRRVVITRDGLPVGTISRHLLLRWFRDWVISKGLACSAPSDHAARGGGIASTASEPCLRTLDTVSAAP